MGLTVKRTKAFMHNFLTFDECPRVEIEGVRHYQTPVGTFKSVTTILGEKLDKTGLINWRNRVGEEEANKISTQAARRGTSIHSLAESYLMNDPNWSRGAMPFNIATFSSIKPILDMNIGSIYGIEVPLYSHRLKAAGTGDLLAGWIGINSIIDFKTSKRVKKEDDIESYFLQTTAYSIMAEEITGLKFPQIVIIMAIDHEDPKIFVKNRDEYIDRVMDIFK